jgi:hypothetical protein
LVAKTLANKGVLQFGGAPTEARKPNKNRQIPGFVGTKSRTKSRTDPGVPLLIIERDDGRYQIGLHDDAPGPFPSRRFAEAVAIREARHAIP